MAKKIIKRKGYRPLTYHIYADGGWGQQSSAQFKGAFSKDSVGSSLGAIGGTIGTIVGAGVNNAKLNDELIQATENDINQKATSQVEATSNEALLEEWSNNESLDNISWRDIRGASKGQMAMNTIGALGSGAATGAQVGGPYGAIAGAAVGLGSALAGIFTGNKKAKKKAKELNQQIDQANAAQIGKLANRAEAIDTQNDLTALAGLLAEGGYLFDGGGKIHIKPSKRGTFTAAAKRHGKGVQEFARQVLANKDNYSSAMVKKANFARNASKWKHAEGGFLEEDTPEYHRTTLRNDEDARRLLLDLTMDVTNKTKDIRYRGAGLYARSLDNPKNAEGLVFRANEIHPIDSLYQVGNWKEAADGIVRGKLGGKGVNTNVFNPEYLLNEDLVQRMRDVHSTYMNNKVDSKLASALMAMNYDETLTKNLDDLYNYKKTQRPTIKDDGRIINYGIFSFENLREANEEDRKKGVTTNYVEDSGMTLGQYKKYLKDNDLEDSLDSQVKFYLEKFVPSRIKKLKAQGININLEQLVKDGNMSDIVRALYKIQGGKVTDNKLKNAVERANFLNKSTFGYGGHLFDFGGAMVHGGDFNNGVNIVDEGGTHEENPMGGVMMGIAPDGQPNLVEEGEVIFNDYVFSNRLAPDESILDIVKLPTSYSNSTYARIAEDLSKESSERPNDPISRRGLYTSLTKLQLAQELMKEREDNKKARGGHLFNTGGDKDSIIGELRNVGSRYTPFSYGQSGYMNITDPNANIAALHKEGSDYRRKRQYILDHWDDPYVQNYLSTTYRGIVEGANKDRFEDKRFFLDKDQFARGTLDGMYGGMYKGVEAFELPATLPEAPNPLPFMSLPEETPFEYDEDLDIVDAATVPTEDKFRSLDWLRYAPAVGAGIGAIQSLFAKPDFEEANMIGRVVDGFRNVDYKPLGNYLTYRPLDRNYYLNKLGAQSGASRRAILNTSGGNRAAALAGILASDYNTGNQIGNLARQAEEYNLAQRQMVENFNRGTNQYNSQMDFQAQNANNQVQNMRLQGRNIEAQYRQRAKDLLDSTRSANITDLFGALGDIGWEDYNRNMARTNPAYYYTTDRRGRTSYKGKSSAKGGYLTISKKRKKR